MVKVVWLWCLCSIFLVICGDSIMLLVLLLLKFLELMKYIFSGLFWCML